MRMTALRGRLGSNERGGTIVFIAVCLVVILGMVALVVDVGGELVMRRRMVNAADAGALAAALSCAKGLPDEAPGQADSFATQNVGGATRDSYSADNCGGIGSGSVTVKYHATVPRFFAEILGFTPTQDVAATAKAIWQPSVGAIVIPVEMSTQNGIVPCITQQIGTECNYWHDQGNLDLPNDSDWGFMNLGEQWDVRADASCHDPGAGNLRRWIHTGLHVSLDPSGTTYVCVSQGFEDSTWLGALNHERGQLKTFPVNDPATMIRTQGNAKYSIIGFSSLVIEAVLPGNTAAALSKCPGHAPDSNAVCVVGLWEGFQVGGDEGSGGSDQGLRTIRLSG